MQQNKRQHIIDTALMLFNQNGFHNTGVNLIMEKAGISKKTLYAYFRSKEDLIAAVLQHADSLARNGFMKAVDQSSDDPIEKILNCFDITKEWFESTTFFGCTFVNAIAEYSEGDTDIRQICVQSKKLKKDYIRKLCEEAGLERAADIAEELAILIDGATVSAQVNQNAAAADIAKKAARRLIQDHKSI